MARLIHASPKEIVFTSGATESDNLALKGVAEANRSKGQHIITQATEHKAVLDTCKRLEKSGCEATDMPVAGDGRIDLGELRRAITPTTILISTLNANNEIGVIQPVGEIGTIAKLTRVGMLAPVVLTLGFMATRRLRRSGTGEPAIAAKAPIPWFVFGFLALMVFNSVMPIEGPTKVGTVAVTTFLLSMALAAMGLEADIRKLRAEGLRPLFLGLAASLFIATFSLCLVKIIA